MEAPEKIYLVRTTRIIDEWRKKPSHYGHNIEYARTDAIIEKVCKFLSNEANIPLWEDYNTFGCDTTKLIDNFKNYMKGE
jgi:hypothetical protein